jgi:hypothetical protein
MLTLKKLAMDSDTFLLERRNFSCCCPYPIEAARPLASGILALRLAERHLNTDRKGIVMLNIRFRQRAFLAVLPLLVCPATLVAQAPAMARQLGTVKAVEGNTVTLTTSAGSDVTVTVSADAPVLQLPPGSTDLKAATPAKLADIAVGDRVLASGKAGDTPGTLTALRVVVMKSSDIAARNAAEQRAWQRGLGGLVKSVDGNVITVGSGARVIKIETTPATTFKRYAADSVDFANALPSTLADVHVGDQVRARGTLADDRLSITADQVVTGTFENLSGAIASVDVAAQSLTLKDLATKKTVTVYVTPKSDLRSLPAQAAAAFAARSRPGGAATAGAGQAVRPSGAGAAGGADSAGARPHSAGFDLSQMLARLPTESLSDLHAGQAVMIVASPGANGNPTAITLLSGVDAILSATPSGQQPITLSPWNIGEPEGGGAESGAGGNGSGGGGAGAAGGGVK